MIAVINMETANTNIVSSTVFQTCIQSSDWQISGQSEK